ncbi:MAG: type VI secretion system tip protein VgrG [Deltaproteobacteria bacterium]|nr:type VI secretion system tip protein VgrG [Deltaproteobacteria bacterium]
MLDLYVIEGLPTVSEYTHILRMSGAEALDGLYAFRLDLAVEHEQPLSHEVIDQAMSERLIFGFFEPQIEEPEYWITFPRSITYLGSDGDGRYHYRFEVLASDWRSDLFRRSRIFQDQDVLKIADVIFKEQGRKNEIKTTRTYPVREYTVQYEETDTLFLRRLLEHEGIFHWFDGMKNKRVLADDNSAFTHAAGHEFVKWAPRLESKPALTDLTWERRVVPSMAVVRDYDWRAPGSLVQADRAVEAHGFGLHVYFGDHVKAADAPRLASVRAEELGFPHQVLRATSNIRGLRPGNKLTLEAPAKLGPELDGIELVVAEVRHEIDQGDDDKADAAKPYRNELVLFPFSVPYRPARVTPKPRIDGLVYAIVDGEMRSTAAPVDDQGRYRVFFPFDTNAKAGGRASRWVRMAQPYAGAGYGMHMPLHIGTQVIVAHINGDPDRPVIVGAIPNADTTSPVHSANATQSAIRSHGGILFELEDDA